MHSESGGLRALRYGRCSGGLWVQVEGEPQGAIELEIRGVRLPLQGRTVLVGQVLPAELVLWVRVSQGLIRVPPVGEIQLQSPSARWWA
jgi:hypothetical protein